MRTGKVSWDGLDGLTDCPALPSLPYLLHRLLGGHQDDQDDDDHHKDNMLPYLSHFPNPTIRTPKMIRMDLIWTR